MKKTIRKISILYTLLPTIILLYMVFVPFLYNTVASNDKILDNRPLYQKPVKFNKNFSKEYEMYYNDTFAGRRGWIRKYIKLQDKLKIYAEKFFHGLDGWMFFDSSKAGDVNSIIDYKGEIYFSDEELQEFLKGVLAARDFYKSKGAEYIIVVAPNKENIYHEYMPVNLQKSRKNSKSRMDQAIEYIKDNSDINIVNMKQDILDAKGKYGKDLYFKKDTHWNAIGGYVGYKGIVEKLDKMGFDVPYTTLSTDMIHETELKDVDMHALEKEMAYRVDYIPNVNYIVTHETANGKQIEIIAKDAPIQKNVLIIRDSFIGELTPFISKAFNKTFYLHRDDDSHKNIDNILENNDDFDLVIDQMVERNFIRLLKYDKFYGGRQ